MSENRVEGMHLVANDAQAAAKLMKDGVIDGEVARQVITTARTEGLELTDVEVTALLG